MVEVTSEFHDKSRSILSIMRNHGPLNMPNSKSNSRLGGQLEKGRGATGGGVKPGFTHLNVGVKNIACAWYKQKSVLYVDIIGLWFKTCLLHNVTNFSVKITHNF